MTSDQSTANHEAFAYFECGVQVIMTNDDDDDDGGGGSQTE